MIPPQFKLAGAALVVVVLFLSGFMVSNWRTSGKMEAAKAAKEKAQLERDEAVAFRDTCIGDLAAINEKLRQMEASRDEAERLYQEAVSRPPQIVTEYRDRWHTVTETIVSTECRAGVAELFSFIHDLPERPQ